MYYTLQVVACMAIHILPFSAVPPPGVVVTVPEGTHYVGTPLTLTCDITVDSAVDTSVMAEVTWTGPGAMSGDTTTETVMTGVYQSTLELSPLSALDAGQLQL